MEFLSYLYSSVWSFIFKVLLLNITFRFSNAFLQSPDIALNSSMLLCKFALVLLILSHPWHQNEFHCYILFLLSINMKLATAYLVIKSFLEKAMYAMITMINLQMDWFICGGALSFLCSITISPLASIMLMSHNAIKSLMANTAQQHNADAGHFSCWHKWRRK